MLSLFVQMVKPLISARFKSRREFIRHAQPESDEATAQGYLAKVLKGTRPPPMEYLDGWAKALEIPDKDLSRFMDLAAIAHLPDVVQPRFVELVDKVALIEARQDAIESRRQRVQK